MTSTNDAQGLEVSPAAKPQNETRPRRQQTSSYLYNTASQMVVSDN